MISFGADAVFKTGGGGQEDGDIADADIDAILQAAEEKTKGLNEALTLKAQKAAGGASAGAGLLDFKIEGGSAQFFEGVETQRLVHHQDRHNP